MSTSHVRRHCQQCAAEGRFQLLELMWRIGGRGPWHWVASYWCASCRSAFLGFIGRELTEIQWIS